MGGDESDTGAVVQGLWGGGVAGVGGEFPCGGFIPGAEGDEVPRVFD